VIRDVAVYDILSKSPGNIEENICRRCHDSEIQLMEALSELSSAQMIISILQYELISGKASKSVGTENSHGEPDKEVWKTVMYNNNSNDKSQKRAKPFWNDLV
jgi:hypothetical protein